MKNLLFEQSDWTFELLDKTWSVIDDIGRNVYKLDYYPPQIEIVTYEQMLDAYSTIGMPIQYKHWSFGKTFLQHKKQYDTRQSGLAYEMIINTNPAIAYLMENNSMTMQALVLAHACCGHAHFFKNNYLFKQWTDPDAILDYLVFAKNYVTDCEDKYGEHAVEGTLDALHAIKYYGVDKYKRKGKAKQEEIDRRKTEWVDNFVYSDRSSWTPEQIQTESDRINKVLQKLKRDPRALPEENLLYFMEKYSPILEPWQRELARIVRKINQYFYPQSQTKMMNEGFASFVHYNIMTYLYDHKQLSEGQYLEFLHSHTNVLNQRDFDDSNYSGLNPYALGYAMFRDIQRICEEPTEEDRLWFPEIAGSKDWATLINSIVVNYRDDSFVLQYLSPKVVRDFKLFSLLNDSDENYYEISEIHSEEDVHLIRERLATQYTRSDHLPEIEVTDVDWDDTRTLELTHRVKKGRLLEPKSAKETLAYIEYLWGFDVTMDIEVEE